MAYIWAKKDSKGLKMVSGVCLCYIVSPYAIVYKSFDFRVKNIYEKKIEELENKCGRNVV